MAETKKEVKANDPWSTPKETWVYVTVPEEEPTGNRFPTIWLNKISFEAGHTYHIPTAVASYLNERIRVYNRSVIRLFQPGVDKEALRVVPVGSAPSGDRTLVTDASNVNV